MARDAEGCGKVRHRSLALAKVSAHSFARELNQSGQMSETLYAYKCPDCRGSWHTTREAREGNVLVFVAPTRSLQEWAIHG